MPVHVLIVGAGVAGPACALSLQEAGYTVCVAEAYPSRAEVGAALMVAPNGLAMLDRFGLADRVVSAGSPIDRYSFLSQGGRTMATLRMAPEGRYRYPGVSLSRATLYGIMLDAVAERGVTVSYGKRLVGVEQDADGVTARFADGEERRAAILIGADGIHSSVRALALGESPEPQFTGLIGGGGFVPRSIMSRLLGAGQEGAMTFAAGDGAFFGCAFGDRQEDRGAYWWYSLPRERPIDDPAREALSGDRAAGAVLKAGNGWSKLVRDIVEATTDYVAPMDIFDVATLPRWSRGRVVLVGDAAHAVAPHSGQGASMALEDAVVLAARLKSHPGDHAGAFAAYERDRRPRAERVVEMGRRTGEQKARGWLTARVQTLLMPLFMKLAPPQDWLFGYEAS